MVDQRVVRIEHLLAVAAGRCLRIAVVHPDRLRRAGGQCRNVHPDQCEAQVRVELLDLMGQHRTPVGRNETQVVATLLGAIKTEVAGMQAQQQRRTPGVAGQPRALWACVDGDRLAILPFGLPPVGIGRGGGQRDQRSQQQQHSGKQTVHAKGLRRTHLKGRVSSWC
ncbi:hypothetical protein D3C78_1471820 [compost metagenome]